MNKIINRLPDWLRWLLLVPTIVCCVVASLFIMSFLIRVNVIWTVIFFFFVSGFIIQISAYIAPKGKLLVSFIFAALLLSFSVFMAIDLRSIILSIICVSGPVVGLIAVKKNICNKLYSKILKLKERMVTIKRTHIFLAVCILLLIAAAGGIFMYIENSTGKSGTLYVNGKEITRENVKIYSNYADLPFTEVLKALGINVEWVDSSTAEFICNSQKYTLNLAEETLTQYGDDDDLLSIIAPGTTFVHQIVLERELVLDSNTLLDNMYAMGNRLRISIDHQKSIVYLTEPED